MTNITSCASQYDCGRKAAMNQKNSGFISNILLKIKTSYAVHKQRRIDRDAFRTLLNLDEASLRDIGVTRNDIIYASKLAMHENASRELEKIRAANIASARGIARQ